MSDIWNDPYANIRPIPAPDTVAISRAQLEAYRAVADAGSEFAKAADEWSAARSKLTLDDGQRFEHLNAMQDAFKTLKDALAALRAAGIQREE